jgi:hypothetical protein
MPSALPRSARNSGSRICSRSRPWNSTRPADGRSVSGSSPITALAHIDLPEPDSPTTQRISPACSVRLRSCTA